MSSIIGMLVVSTAACSSTLGIDQPYVVTDPDASADGSSSDTPPGIDTGKSDVNAAPDGDETGPGIARQDGGSDAASQVEDATIPDVTTPDTPIPDATTLDARDEPICQDGAKRSCAEDGHLGNCAQGTESCTAGQWGRCSVLPQAADACRRGDDANCNGTANEECKCIATNTRKCKEDKLYGKCADGDEICDGTGHWGPCSITPSPDTCALHNDDNCNGTENEGCPCGFIGATRPCSEGGATGTCAAGTQTCSAQGWGDCSIQPAAKDTCLVTGNDDNCNGTPNEGCPCVVSTMASRSCTADGLKGPCAPGTESCVAPGKWGACSIPPASSDTCEKGNDNSCNGTSNEGCICINGVTTRPCGPCNDGTQTCVDGKAGTYGSCGGGTSPGVYYIDADGDGYCNRQVSTQSCGQPAGYLPDSCVSDCLDSNANVNTNCDSYTIDGPTYAKPLGGAETRCFSFTCRAGYHSSNAGSVKTSGGGGLSIESWNMNVATGNVCVRYTCAGLECVTGYGTLTCTPDGM